jgi:hypothetical protein
MTTLTVNRDVAAGSRRRRRRKVGRAPSDTPAGPLTYAVSS